MVKRNSDFLKQCPTSKLKDLLLFVSWIWVKIWKHEHFYRALQQPIYFSSPFCYFWDSSEKGSHKADIWMFFERHTVLYFLRCNWQRIQEQAYSEQGKLLTENARLLFLEKMLSMNPSASWYRALIRYITYFWS